MSVAVWGLTVVVVAAFAGAAAVGLVALAVTAVRDRLGGPRD